MGRQELIKIAKETLEFTENFIRETGSDICAGVEVYSPERLENIELDVDGHFTKSFSSTKGALSYVIDADSFEAAGGMVKPLVMNFANAHRPGGGFLNGARAQEESLCRCSTLYKSISGDMAREMYYYNNTHKDPCDSDYMLLSPNVYVFRTFTGDILTYPYWTSVVTVAAPNRGGSAANVSQDVLDEVMTERLRKMFFLAARRGYRNLILGAWGCGAFGNDTRRVAGYFHELLYGEDRLCELFDKVIFAILGDHEKIAIFKEVFGDDMIIGYPIGEDDEEDEYDRGDDVLESPKYFLSNFEYPLCNHRINVNKHNLGYTSGVTETGVPFEAEVDAKDGIYMLAVVVPVLYAKDFDGADGKDESIPEMDGEKSKVIGLRYEDAQIDYSILDNGMVDEGMEDDFDIIKAYVGFLEDNGIVRFTSDMRNGAVFYRTDANGNALAKVVITLKENENTLAGTDLKLRDFPLHGAGGDKNRFRIVK